ncbi:MAG: alpha/beta hydrolase [Hyphomicrobiaceae bacterium]|nr:alpha/beta hydrolase [Hyphomicrobiaceae bacterium]
MLSGAVNERGIFAARGGGGTALLVLLHGIGANADVWAPVVAEIERRGGLRWMALDLRGHGRSAMEGPFGYGMHAADVAHALRAEAPADVVLLGHSFGGVVAALAASGQFAAPPSRVVGLGVKLEWSREEVTKAQEIAGKPARLLSTRAEAAERYLKGAGLFGLVAPEDAAARAGVIEAAGGFRVAVDPRVFAAVGPPLPPIFAQVACPLRLAAGSRDPMVGLAAMQRIDPAARLLDGLGHNAHWEAPAAVLDLALAV